MQEMFDITKVNGMFLAYTNKVDKLARSLHGEYINFNVS